MGRVARFVIWICSKFNRFEIVLIINGLHEVLADRNPEVKSKDYLKEKHPSYRDFYVDPLPSLRTQPAKEPKTSSIDWQDLLKDYERKHGRPLNPIKPCKGLAVPSQCRCEQCEAPAQ